MRQITAEAEGIPVASVEYPLRWENWKLDYSVVDDGVVEVKGTVNYIYKAYEETTLFQGTYTGSSLPPKKARII